MLATEGRQVVVGVDGGGTKTAVTVLDAATKDMLARSAAGCTNWNSTGLDAAMAVLKSVVEGALTSARASTRDVAGICLGLAGVDREADEERIFVAVHAWFPDTANVWVYNDALVTLYHATDGQPGCVLVAGTGQQALAAVARDHDRYGHRTVLTAAVCEHCGVFGALDLLGWAYAQEGWAPIAALAPLVLNAARAGDAVASDIVHAAARWACSTLSAVVSRCRLQGAFTIVFAGGLLESPGSLFADAVKAEAAAAFPAAVQVTPSVDADTAAALLAHRCLLNMESQRSAGLLGLYVGAARSSSDSVSSN